MFPDEPDWEEYQGPPEVTPKYNSASRDDVAGGRPPVEFPSCDFSTEESLAFRDTCNELMSATGETGVLVEQAVIEWLEQMWPGHQSEEAKAASERVQKITDESREIEPWVEKALIDLRERLVPRYPSSEWK